MKHHIIVKFKPEVSAEQKEELRPAIQALFDNTLSIDGITAVDVIPNCIDRPNRYDLMIVLTMDPAALSAYDACPWHKQWKADYGELIEKKTIFDCE